MTGDMPGSADAVLLVTPVQHLRAALALALPGRTAGTMHEGTRIRDGDVPDGDRRRTPARRPRCRAHWAEFRRMRSPPATRRAAVVASTDPALRRALVAMLGTRAFRLYGSADPIGAQVGGGGEERDCHRRRHRHRRRAGRKRACRRRHPGACGDQPPGGGAGRPGGDGGRPVRLG